MRSRAITSHQELSAMANVRERTPSCVTHVTTTLGRSYHAGGAPRELSTTTNPLSSPIQLGTYVPSPPPRHPPPPPPPPSSETLSKATNQIYPTVQMGTYASPAGKEIKTSLLSDDGAASSLAAGPSDEAIQANADTTKVQDPRCGSRRQPHGKDVKTSLLSDDSAASSMGDAPSEG